MTRRWSALLGFCLCVGTAATPTVAFAQDTFVEEDDDATAFAAEPEDVASEPSASEPAASEPTASADEPEPSAPPPSEVRRERRQPKPTPTAAPPRSKKGKLRPKAKQRGKEAEEPKASGESPFLVQKMSYAAVVERWDAYLRVLKAREVSRMRRFEGEFEQGRKAFGLHGLPNRPSAPAMGVAAAMFADRSYRNGDIERGDEMMRRAHVLAPDEPGIHMADARFALSYKNDGPGAIRHTIGAVEAVFRHPTAKVTALTWVVTIAILAVLLWFVLVSVVFLGRSFRMLTFDLHAALPRGAARWQVWVLVALAAIAPILGGLGPLLVALCWLTIAALYLARREQSLLLGLALVCVALPFGADFASTTWTWGAAEASSDYTALLDVAAAPARESLKTKDPVSLSPIEEMALATEAKREGELEDARKQWRGIVQRRPQDTTGHESLGTVAGILGEFDLAKAEFEAARNSGSEAKSNAYNLSLLYLRQGNRSQAEMEVAKLVDDRDLHERFRAATFTGNDDKVPHNRAFVDPSLPLTPVRDLFAAPPAEAAQLNAEVREIAWFGWATTTAAGGAGVLLLVWIILIVLSERLKPSHPCRRCGTPASERYDAPDVPRGTCSGCFNVFESKTARIEPSRRAAKDVQIIQWRRLRHRLAVGLSFVWPGLGHLYAGATLAGIALSLLYLPVVVGLVLSSSIFPWPGYSGLTDGTVFLGLFALMGTGLIALAAFLAHRKTE